MAEIIRDSSSFYRHIMRNRFLTEAQTQDVLNVLDDQLEARIGAANADGSSEKARDAYMFFQGAVMGMLLMAKQMKLHYENTGWEQGIDPQTGDSIKGHGNA